MPHNNTTHTTTQLELFDPESLYFVSWINKDGKEKQTKHAVNLQCAITFIRILGYDRTTKNPIIKKAPMKNTDALTLAKPTF